MMGPDAAKLSRHRGEVNAAIKTHMAALAVGCGVG